MSVPVVRYTAAANYEYAAAANAAFVASGLNHTLTQEEQYHLYQQQQQQLQQQQEELYYQQQHNLNNTNEYYQAEQQQQVLRQQQFMQQQRSSSSLYSSPRVNIFANMPMEQDIMSNNHAGNVDAVEQQQQQTASITNNNGKQILSTNGSDNVVGAEWRMSDEGRYGTPGAAGLEYQKYSELNQQQQQQLPTGNAPIEQQQPSLLDNGNNANENIDEAHNNNNNNNKSNANAVNLRNLEEELNALTSNELFNTLKEYDALQDKYHTVLLLPKDSRREVTAGGRDGSAYVLRCLKMWYELPSDVLFSAMSLVDRFLDRMTVKPKHMACLSVASFHLAIKQLGLKPIPAEDLINISQCGCTAGDLERMANVIANKLGVQLGQGPITSVSFLRIYYQLFRNCAKEIGGPFYEFYQRFIKLEELENRLENLLCDVKTTVITPSVLALVLISLHLDFHIKASYTRGTPELKIVFNYILDLQQFMRISDRVFSCGFSIVSGILSHYNGQNKQPYKQRLVWKLSTRTLRVLRPTKSFSSDLPTIEEGISNVMEDGCRSRTESISSEEEEDWPTSPIIPIFEQC